MISPPPPPNLLEILTDKQILVCFMCHVAVHIPSFSFSCFVLFGLWAGIKIENLENEELSVFPRGLLHIDCLWPRMLKCSVFSIQFVLAGPASEHNAAGLSMSVMLAVKVKMRQGLMQRTPRLKFDDASGEHKNPYYFMLH